MSPPPSEYRRHMLAEAEYVHSQSADILCDELLAEETLKGGFVRSVESIGLDHGGGSWKLPATTPGTVISSSKFSQRSA